MARRIPLHTKVVEGGHKPRAEELPPDAVDHHSRRERIGRIDQPAGKPQPVLGHRLAKLSQRHRDLRRERLRLLRLVILSAVQQIGRPHLAAVFHDHRGLDRRRELVPLCGEGLDLGLELCELGLLGVVGLERRLRRLRVFVSCRSLSRLRLGGRRRRCKPGRYLSQQAIQLREPPGLLGGGQRNHRRHVAPPLVVDTLLINIVEERKELIEVAAADGIVFVVVAAGAAHRQAEKRCRGCLHTVDHVLHPPLFINRAALGDHAVVAVEAGGNQLLLRGLGQQITGELLQEKLIRRHVGVERADHPVPPGPHAAVEVVLIAVGVGEAGDVEPVGRHPLAVVGRGQQAIDLFLECIARHVGRKRREFGRRRRQPRQIKRNPPQPLAAAGRLARLKALGVQAGPHEVINRGPRPGRAFAGWHNWHRRWHKRPVPRPGSPLIDPATQQCDLFGRQLPLGLRGRHADIVIRALDPVDQFTRCRVAANNHVLGRGLFRVEPQVRRPLLGIRPVAGKAVARQDRQDVACKVDRLLARCVSSPAAGETGGPHAHHGEQGTHTAAMAAVHSGDRLPESSSRCDRIPVAPESTRFRLPRVPSGPHCSRRGGESRRSRTD